MNWDDLRVFLAVAEDGSLSAAARRLKVSQPTVGRRLAALEDRIETRLFDRLPDGFLLTGAGAALLPHVQDMARAAEAAERQRASFGETVGGEVRISVAEVTGQFLAEHLQRLRGACPGIEIELAVSHISANLSRREADLLIRFCVPDYGTLVARKLAVMGQAVYAAKSYLRARGLSEEGTGAGDLFREHDWIAWDEEHQYMPGAEWVTRGLTGHLEGRAAGFRSNHALAIETAARKGAGLAVLPCFAGDADPELVRLTAPIAEASPPLHLLVHPDLRRVPHIRLVMDALVALYLEERPALAGDGTVAALAAE